MPTRTLTDRTLAHPLVSKQLVIHAGNLTQISYPSKHRRAIDSELTQFARATIGLALTSSPTCPDFSDPEWQRAWANQSEETMLAAGLDDLIAQTSQRLIDRYPRRIILGANFTSLSLLAICNATGQVSRLLACGLDPDLLTTSEEQREQRLLGLTATMLDHGTPVAVLA